MTAPAVKWYRSLGFQGLAGLGCVTLLLFAGIVGVINTRGKKSLSDASSRLIEATGNQAVSELNARSLEIAALARTLAATAEQLPKSEATFKTVLPALINFQGDLAVAGGGIWPEPYAFRPEQERSSFFWGREAAGTLRYYDDYNQSQLGYHHEEWYVPARYTPPNSCFWSRSYIDPYSLQPMVTCTIAMFNQQQFSGVATIDLKLEGLQDFATSLQEKTGGYVFILDRNNRFITFPQQDRIKTASSDRQGNQRQRFLLAAELAAQEPLFAPLAEVVEAMNRDTLAQARRLPSYDPAIVSWIDRNSYQINAAEAELIWAVISNPYRPTQRQTYLHRQLDLDNDFLLNETATAFIFHVPNSYWKLIIVKPVSQINAVTANIIQWLTGYMLATVVLVMVTAFFALNRFLIRPLSQTTNSIRTMGQWVANRQFDQRTDLQLKGTSPNEIGLLAQVFNLLATEVFEQHRQLEQANEDLEAKVVERTTELAAASAEIVALNERLTTENLRMSAELAIARQLQQMILPKAAELSQIAALDIAGLMEPAAEVSGDYYDVLHQNGRLHIGIGDVTGHGLESSVLMIMVQTAVRTLLHSHETDPVKVLNVINQTLYENIQRMNSDKTLTLALVDYEAGRLRLSGQHEEMIIVRASGQVQRIDTIDLGFPLGLEPDISPFVASLEIELEPGDGVVLYTDGITEAENSAGQHYGLERLCEVVSRHWQESAVAIQTAVRDDLQRHIGQHRVYDDITLLVLKQK